MLIKGKDLNSQQVAIVKSAFVYRNTVEKPCKTVFPEPKGTDREWINEHAFHFTKDGSRLMENRHYAEPAWMACIE